MGIACEDAPLDRVTDLMVERKVIGWLQGRMEFGPRALGCPSIIGDSRNPTMQATTKVKIKWRGSSRPFAPCVLREQVSEYFTTWPEESSPYLLLLPAARHEHRTKLTVDQIEPQRDPDLCRRVNVPWSTVPAITHVDYSARMETIDEERHGRYYRLMKRFEAKRGAR